MCGQWQLNCPRLPALSNSSTTSPTTPQFLPSNGKTPGPLNYIKLIINTSSPLPKRTKIKINQGQGDEKQRSTSPCVNEAEAQVDDSHLRHNARAPPRQGRAHEVLPLSPGPAFPSSLIFVHSIHRVKGSFPGQSVVI